MFEVVVKNSVKKTVLKMPKQEAQICNIAQRTENIRTRAAPIYELFKTRQQELPLPPFTKMGCMLDIRKGLFNHRGILCRQS